MDDDVTAPHRVPGGLGQCGDLDPPLQTQPRLDRFTAAFGMSDAVQIRPLLGHDAALAGQRLSHLHPSFEAVQPVELRFGSGDPTTFVHDRGHSQVVPYADLEIVRIMGRRDFDCTSAEFGIDVSISDHHDLAVLKRMRQRGPHQMAVAIVVGVHGDRGIAEHGLDPRGRHHNVGSRIIKGAIAK